MQVDAVVDQLQDDTVTLENGKQDAGFTVMERTHAIAQMGCLRGAGIEGRGRDLVVAHRCARVRRHTVIDDHPHRLDATGELWRQRDHAHSATTECQQVEDLCAFRWTQEVGRVRARAQRGQPGPFEMNTGKFAGLDERGEIGHLRLEVRQSRR